MVLICAAFLKQSHLYSEDSSRTWAHTWLQLAGKQETQQACEEKPPAMGISLIYSRGVSPHCTLLAQISQLFNITLETLSKFKYLWGVQMALGSGGGSETTQNLQASKTSTLALIPENLD